MKYFKVILTCCLIFTSSSTTSYAAQNKNIPKELAGSIEAEIDGELIQFPSLKTDVKANIQGDIANIKIIQLFENPTNTPLNARYLFPINKDAAVHAMTMEVGDEIIKATIRRKEDAKKTFEKAKKTGKAASLLTQHRPNMFTQKIANLMPGLPVTVTLEYTQSIPKQDGAFELVIPLIVGPRFEPLSMGNAPDIIDDGVLLGQEKSSSHSSFGIWELENKIAYPDVNGITLPKSIDANRVSIEITLNTAIPLQSIYSDTHNIETKGNNTKKIITLRKKRIIDNADFILRYQLAGKETQAGFLSEPSKQGHFFSLMIEPPALPDETQITAREMVFVLDTSGSMNGEPIEASKTFMQHAMKELRPGDSFRIIRFSDNASEYNNTAVPATPYHIKDGLDYIKSLRAAGGTNIPLAISQAFAPEEKKDVLRIVVFLSDGYIGNEATVLRQIASTMGQARIYAFGIGSSVNRYLLSEMGRRGRGFTRFIDPKEDVHDAAISFAKKLNAPVLTDIEIDWGDINVEDVTPALIPDLFAGDSIRIQGYIKGQEEQTHTIHINGQARGQKASLPLQISLNPANDNEKKEGKTIALLWARSRIADYMRMLNTPFEVRYPKIMDDEIKDAIVKLGLDYSLMTKWTSFIAVSEKIVNKAPKQTKDKNIALPKVKGITKMAYKNNFSGGSVPEPATTGAFLVLGGAGLSALRQKKKRNRKIKSNAKSFDAFD